MLQTTEDYKALMKLVDVIASWDELETVVIWLKLQPNIVSKLRSENHSIMGLRQPKIFLSTDLALQGIHPGKILQMTKLYITFKKQIFAVYL